LVPTAKVLVLTAYADDFAAAALKAGAQGFLIKDITGQELIRAVRSVTQGTSPIHLSVPTADLSSVMGSLHNHKHALSARQLKVLRLVAAGDSKAEIARKLIVSERTVKRELSEIFQKLGVDSRTKAVAYADEHHLI
jgi:DNA-binding NarL/FixJ family response regulator